MGSLKTRLFPQVLLHLLLLRLQCAKVQAADPMSLKLRRLNEQFHQFKTSTQTRLDTLALNQDKASSHGQKSRAQPLNNRSHQMSRDLEQLKHSTALDMDALRDWSKKLEKKNKRMDARLALMERKLGEKCQHAQKLMPHPGLNFSKFTMELQSQDERLADLQTQHDMLQLELKGLQESMKKQALHISQLEAQLSEVVQGTGKEKVRGPSSSRITAQRHYEPHRRMVNREGMSRRIIDPHIQPSAGQISTGREAKSHQFHVTNQPEVKPKQSKSNPDFYNSQSQIQTQVQRKSSPKKMETHSSYLQRQIRLPDHKHLSLMQPLSRNSSHLESSKDLQDRMRIEGNRPAIHTRGREGQENKSDTNLESSLIQSFLQIPVRHKIPDQPLPRKNAAICNVDSMLLFPSASAENYVTFSVSLPDLPELSLCLWLRVEAPHVGTLLSYATDDNDNQLVLYGRRSSTLSTPFPPSSLSSHPSYSFSPPSSFPSPSVDFVIGDPVYRRLFMASLLDGDWHHMCVVWSSIQGRFWYYSDRYLTSSGSNFRKGWEIPGGGSVVLGQEQDSLGGGFDPEEGFAGHIAGFRVWNRVLSSSEVEGVANGRGVPRGVVLGMEDIKEVHGDVEHVACQCLEHCV